jgi:puromycin-sensitive aminopeptidase
MLSNPYRLGREVKPVLYDLEIEPDLARFTFTGHETITLEVFKPIDRIVLHAVDIKIQKAFLTDTGKSQFAHAPKKISYDAKFETAIFLFSEKIKPGHYSLKLEFTGELNDKMHGFYRTSYSVDGSQRWGAATQFEATDARRCFPCFDEPDLKARFRAALRVPKHLTALSNMPVENEFYDPNAKKKIIQYETTPVMSTYLLCFVVAELEFVEAKDRDGVLHRVWTTPGKKEQGLFGLDVALHTLPYFADWFGIPYALPKLDMVALPDFSSGAMENWGLVTYRETALLVDPKNSSAAARQRVAEVIDHELAHQWFGNLVTMEWWTDLWLNEGFASYMGPKAVHAQFPEWDVWNQFVSSETLTALHDDALKNSHPIEIPVKDPSEIREIFDHITYNKGAAVNRMLEHFLSEEVFQKGLRIYLKKFAYQNAQTVDLWAVLEEVSKQPVKAIMASFTKQEGYPVVSVDVTPKKTIQLSQRRFIFDGSKDTHSMSWKVPITAQIQGSTKKRTAVLEKRTLELPDFNLNGGWVKLNPDQSGFYRANYSKELLDRLIVALAKNELSVNDCLGLVDDTYSLAKAGFMKTSFVFDVLQNCQKQTDYNLWLTVSGILGSVEHILVKPDQEAALKRFSLALLAPLWKETGWLKKETDGHMDILRRSLVISRMGHCGDKEVIEECRNLFQFHLKTGDLDPNIRSAVYGVAAANGGEDELNAFLNIYRKTELQEEKVRVLRALTRFKSKDTIQKVLDFSLGGEVRPQDTYVLLAGFGGNEKARKQNWAFVKKNWKKLEKLYKSGSVGLLGHILEGSTGGFITEADLANIETFFKSHPVPGTERTRKQTIEVIKANIKWKKRDEADIVARLKS